MILDKVELLRVRYEGKLKSYNVTPSFIEVFYSHPELEKGSYYVFLFVTSNQKLLKSGIQVNPRIVIRPKKQYFGLIKSLVKELVSDFNSGSNAKNDRFYY